MTDNSTGNQRANPGVHNTMSGSAPRKKRRRRISIAALCIGALAVLAVASAAWLGTRATAIRDELNAATKLVPQLKAEIIQDDAVAAARTVAELKDHTSAARVAAADPLWTLAGALPGIGANFQAAAEVAESADDVAQLAAVPLVSVYQSLDWKTLVPNGNGIDPARLAAARPTIVKAAASVTKSSDRLDRIDTAPLLPQISSPLILARTELSSLSSGLNTAADFSVLAPDMLGGKGTRNYLLIIQNSAEVRSTGGIPGALAKLSIENGRLSLGSQTGTGALGTFSPSLPVDLEQERIYSSRLGTFVQDVNLTPDFPTAARTARAMWERRTGERLDGVISVDPVALGYILDATGPIRLTDPAFNQLGASTLPTELTGKNVVPTLLSEVYAKIGNPELQDAYFAVVAKEIFGALSAGNGDGKALVNGVIKGATERRILVWSAVGVEQSVIETHQLSGSITGAAISPGQFGVYFNDGTGAKMDYYVKRTVQLVQECRGDDYGQIKVRITSTNTAPADAATSLPSYVTGGGVFGVPRGTVQTNVTAYGPVQANVETAHVDGKKVSFAANRHANRPVGTVTVTLAPGQSSTVEMTFGKIVQHTEPDLVVTPTVQPVKEVVLATEPAVCVPEK